MAERSGGDRRGNCAAFWSCFSLHGLWSRNFFLPKLDVWREKKTLAVFPFKHAYERMWTQACVGGPVLTWSMDMECTTVLCGVDLPQCWWMKQKQTLPSVSGPARPHVPRRLQFFFFFLQTKNSSLARCIVHRFSFLSSKLFVVSLPPSFFFRQPARKFASAKYVVDLQHIPLPIFMWWRVMPKVRVSV